MLPAVSLWEERTRCNNWMVQEWKGLRSNELFTDFLEFTTNRQYSVILVIDFKIRDSARQPRKWGGGGGLQSVLLVYFKVYTFSR